MKTVLTIVGVVLALIGAVWILQGLNILPGSFMTGQLQWAVYGAISLTLGCIAVFIGRRRARP